MTTREATSPLPLSIDTGTRRSAADWAALIGFGAIQWPWLLRGLWGGRRSDKAVLLDRLGLPRDALPKLGGWKADVGLLTRIVDTIEMLHPAEVVELGAGASTLVIAKALALNGGGRLTSIDQHEGFVAAVRDWLGEHGLSVDLHHAPLVRAAPPWAGLWYRLERMPNRIDLLVVDGPNWSLHPLVRGSAERLFARIAPGGIVMLDDAARPGERIIALRWRKRWPDFEWTHLPGIKGTLVGRRKA